MRAAAASVRVLPVLRHVIVGRQSYNQSELHPAPDLSKLGAGFCYRVLTRFSVLSVAHRHDLACRVTAAARSRYQE